MVLYAADLIDFEKPKPISKEPEVEKVVKPKKEMSEKQKASLLKAQETRRLKKEAAEKEKVESEALAQKLQDAALKKPRKKVKVEEKVEVKVEQVKPKVKKEKVVKVAEPVPEEPKKRKRELKPKSNDPPEWFKKYVEGVQKEKAASGGDVSKKQETIIKNEALKVAQKSWDSGFTRDRVQNEVDSHSKI
jgi:hypothetical protein